MRALAPGYVDHLELNAYLNELLGSATWRKLYAVPHLDSAHHYQHLFDIYGS